MAKLHPSLLDLKSCKLSTVIEIERGIGRGDREDTYRIVREYYSLNGKLLARHDTLIDEEMRCG